MRLAHVVTVMAVGLAAVMLLGLSLRTAVTVQAEAIPVDLVLISEETGYIAATSPLSADCFFDDDYQLYLCEPPAPAERAVSDPAARAQALSLLNNDGALFIINSTAKLLMVFDPHSGDLIDPAFIELDEAETGTAIHAILGPSPNQILISDQTRDVVHEYNFDGDYLGVFAPAGGANTAILDNIRGIALRPNGNLLVTVASGTNANAIAEFDTAGNYLGNFIANSSGGLNSPFDVYERPDTDWLVSSINSNQILNYQWASGAPIGVFASISSFPQQIYDIANGNALVANFSGTQGVYEFTSAGASVGVYNPPGISGYRGVYELGNGNILASTSGGVFEINRSGALVDTKFTGQSRFIEYIFIQTIDLNKTVGLDSSDCAETSEINVGPDTAVTYCFEITNNTAITLTRHDLADSQLGVILEDAPFSLSPGATLFVTQTAVITQTTINTATWTAYNPGPSDLFTSSDTATVTVTPPSIAFAVTVGEGTSGCAETDEIEVEAGAAVTYCFAVTNTGLTTFSQHDLEDSQFGELLNGLSLDLLPGTTALLTRTAVITQTTINTATWTAYNPGPTHLASATASAAVTIAEPELSLVVTVGVEPNICAATNVITVTVGTPVVYCYTIYNQSGLLFDQHSVTDSILGPIANFAYDLQPGAAASLLHTHAILTDTDSIATWVAEATASGVSVSLSGGVTVHTEEAEEMFWLQLRLLKP